MHPAACCIELSRTRCINFARACAQKCSCERQEYLLYTCFNDIVVHACPWRCPGVYCKVWMKLKMEYKVVRSCVKKLSELGIVFFITSTFVYEPFNGI